MPGLVQWETMVAWFANLGSDDPDGDARLLYAGLHGLVSLASTGRANIGDLNTSDRDMAISLARRLARRLTQHHDNAQQQERDIP